MRAGTLLLLIILMEGTDNFVIEKREDHNAEQKLLLRKLLSLQQNNSTEKSTVWNEILANVLVNKIKALFKKQPEYSYLEDKPDVVTEFFGNVIGLFKRSYWDKVDKRHAVDEIQTNDKPTGDPKDEVEEIDPKYHGRIENGTDFDTTSVCPEGSVSDGKGNCVDTKNLKFIMAIPYQCPVGYRRDRLGYCRPLF